MPNSHVLTQFTEDSSVGKLSNANEKVPRYGYMSDEISYRFTRAQTELYEIYEDNYDEIKKVMPDVQIQELEKFLSYIPKFKVDIVFSPLTRALLKINMTLRCDFSWNDRWSGK